MLQQYDPPLEIYNRPANTFVAGFVGNPAMNFVPARVTGKEDGALILDFLGRPARFLPTEPAESAGPEVLLGIRPEFLPIREEGALEASVWSTLPAGMETTVRLSCAGAMLTSVVFGSVDYPVNAPVRLDVTGDRIVLFDAASGNRAAVGRLELNH